MIFDGADSLLASNNREEFTRELVRLVQNIGFDTVSATVFIDQLNAETRMITVDNTPADYFPYFSDMSRSATDPVMQYCKRHSAPIVWDQSTYVERGAAENWEVQAPFGYRHGIALAMHLPGGMHFFLGADRDEPISQAPEERSHLTAAIALLTLQAQGAAFRILLPGISPTGQTRSLTPRELEVLRWTAAGKTAWEVGMLLGISERTAAIHANNATHKLGCVSKHQAALKVFSAGLI